MKILIVDDDIQKAGQIVNGINSIPGLTEDDIHHSTSLRDARLELRKTLYDLLILDLYIPDKIGGLPQADIGIAFIEEICGTKTYNIPLDIVALTAYEDAKDKFASNENLRGFTILEYDQTKKDWINYLVSRIQYLIQCNQQRKITKKPPECDVLWLTTVDRETDALKEFYTWETYNIDNDASIYNISVQECGDTVVNLVHVQLPEMGIASAAAITAKGIAHFDPQYVIMTGIAGGLDKDLNLCDVMISDNVCNYDSGKYVDQVDKEGHMVISLISDGKMLNVPFTFSEQLKQFSRNEREKINNKVGTFACGSAVVASQTKVTQDIIPHTRKAIALDMESYGVLFAAKTTKKPEVPAVVIKGVSDKANADKDDSVQLIAAKNSVIVAMDLIATLFQNKKK